MKCISECDSTTDYENRSLVATDCVGVNVSSLAEGHLSVSANGFIRSHLHHAHHQIPSTQSQKSFDVVVPEVDSTTDLISTNEPTSSLPSHTTCSFSAACAQMKLACNMQPANYYQTTPDLISVFDEEISETTASTSPTTTIVPEHQLHAQHSIGVIGTGHATVTHQLPTAADLCQCTDFLPYITILTQAFLNCTETSQVCDNPEQGPPNDATSYMVHQTAIDNLKALTNLPAHPTNLFSTLNLPKPAVAADVDTLIQSVPIMDSVSDVGQRLHSHEVEVQMEGGRVATGESKNVDRGW